MDKGLRMFVFKDILYMDPHLNDAFLYKYKPKLNSYVDMVKRSGNRHLLSSTTKCRCGSKQ